MSDELIGFELKEEAKSELERSTSEVESKRNFFIINPLNTYEYIYVTLSKKIMGNNDCISFDISLFSGTSCYSFSSARHQNYLEGF